MDDPRNVFRDEAAELLAELETSLLELEDHPDDRELIGRVFRAMHTIKGSGAMFGFNEIAAFTHEVETVYDLVRDGKMGVDSRLVNLSLAARDQIRSLLDAAFNEGQADERTGARIIAELGRLRPDCAPAVQAAEAENAADAEEHRGPMPQEPAEARQAEANYRINFTPNPDLFILGGNPLPLLNELRDLGPCAIKASTKAIPPLEKIEPDASYLAWEITLTTDRGEDAIRDVFIFVEDRCQLTIETLAPASAAKREARDQQLPSAPPEKMISSVQEVATGATDLPDPQAKPGKSGQELASSERQPAAASIRVDAGRLDKLVNQVGELVTVQARLSRLAQQGQDQELRAVAEELEMLTGELRDNTMGVRMMPIGNIFSKFRRLVRDLSQKLGKEVVLTTEGEETELDKTVIEKLNDPFVHLIRNCIDHGIEMPDRRTEAGKPRRGTVHLTAVHSGDSVLIEIRDDGAGLDRAVLRRKAIERSLLGEQDELGEQEAYQLLFLPGFSTAAGVSEVSGRGVGMDVVKRGIESLRGNITLTSEQGRGTTVKIRLPLTLAIIESLLVKIGNQNFALPLGLVEECIELRRGKRDGNGSNGGGGNEGRDLINVRGHLVPYIPLRRRFAINGRVPAIEQVVITAVNGQRVGLVVDEVIGEQQAVIKSLGPFYRQVKDVSGATILGDGSVALILDIPHLIEEGGEP